MAKKVPITGADLMRQLEENHERVAKREARAQRLAERAKQIANDQANIIADLGVVGVNVASVYDFVGQQHAPDIALPVLVKHLKIDHHPNIREGLIRALGVPGARVVAFELLCDIFRSECDPAFRRAVANSLAGMARLEELNDLPGIEEFAALFPNAHGES